LCSQHSPSCQPRRHDHAPWLARGTLRQVAPHILLFQRAGPFLRHSVKGDYPAKRTRSPDPPDDLFSRECPFLGLNAPLPVLPGRRCGHRVWSLHRRRFSAAIVATTARERPPCTPTGTAARFITVLLCRDFWLRFRLVAELLERRLPVRTEDIADECLR